MANTKPTPSRNLSITNMEDMLTLAQDIKKFIEENKLSTNVQGKNFPQAEAWQYAGNRLNILQKAGYIKNVSDSTEIKYEASVVLLDASNNFAEIGQGFAVCSNKEQGKKYYQEFAIASMAQTRAIGKAYRILLSFVMRLAGYEPTPAEEMDYDSNKPTPAKAPVSTPQPAEKSQSEAEAEELDKKTPATKEQMDLIHSILDNPFFSTEQREKGKAGKYTVASARAMIKKLNEMLSNK